MRFPGRHVLHVLTRNLQANSELCGKAETETGINLAGRVELGSELGRKAGNGGSTAEGVELGVEVVDDHGGANEHPSLGVELDVDDGVDSNGHADTQHVGDGDTGPLKRVRIKPPLRTVVETSDSREWER